jgi:hypothetical protein
VASLFGVSISDVKSVKNKDASGHYSYTYTAKFSLSRSGRQIEATGMRSSRDDFFTGKEKKDKDGNVVQKAKSPEEIDERDVRLAAYTNCMNNGVKRILPGLRNIAVSDLEKAKLNTKAIKSYSFDTKQPDEMSEDSKDLRQKMKDMLTEVYGEDEEAKSNALKTITTFTAKDGKAVEGYGSVDKISEKSIRINYDRVKKSYENWKKENVQ